MSKVLIAGAAYCRGRKTIMPAIAQVRLLVTKGHQGHN